MSVGSSGFEIARWIYDHLSVSQRIWLFVIIPVVFLSIVGVLIVQDFFGSQIQEKGEIPDFSSISIENGMAVALNATLSEDEEFPEKINIMIEDVTIPFISGDNINNTFCLHGIYLTTAVPMLEPINKVLLDIGALPPVYISPPTPEYVIDPPLCNTTNDALGRATVQPKLSQEPVTIALKGEDYNPKLFPYDAWQSQSILIYPHIVLNNNKQVTNDIPVFMHIQSTLPSWEETIDINSNTATFLTLSESRIPEWQVTQLDVSLKRPLTQRILTASLLTLLFGFIVGLNFVPEIGAVLEVSVGILLGLWGIQDVLIPNYITGTTLVHLLISILYLLLGIIMYFRFIARPLVKQLQENERLRPIRDSLFGTSDEATE